MYIILNKFVTHSQRNDAVKNLKIKPNKPDPVYKRVLNSEYGCNLKYITE